MSDIYLMMDLKVSKTSRRVLNMAYLQKYIISALVLIAWATWNVPLSYADESARTLTVGAFHIPNLIEKDGTGDYNDILREVTSATGIQFQIITLPSARARASYKKGRYDCLLPLDPLFEGQYINHVQSIPLYEAHLHIFTNEGTPPVKTLDELKGKRVGAQRGLPYPEEVSALTKDTQVNTLPNLVTLLKRARFDAIIAYTPDLPEHIKRHKVGPLSYSNAHPVAIYSDSLTCRPTDKNHALMIEINHALTQLFTPDSDTQ